MPDPHVCRTCGAHLPGDAPPPSLCPICDEPRQYVKDSGQAWGRHDALLADHAPRIEEEAFGLTGGGVLLTGDVVMVIPDRLHVAFMYSYPNLIPLPVREVERIGAALEPLAFDAIVGGWWGRVVTRDGKDVVRRSVARYRRAVEDRLDGAVLPWPAGDRAEP